MKQVNKKNKIEIIIIILIVLLTIIIYLINAILFDNTNKIIYIYQDGVRIEEVDGHKISLYEDFTFTITNEFGEYNVFKIEDKSISCIDSNCEDKICMLRGKIDGSLDTDFIICAPHRLSVHIQ